MNIIFLDYDGVVNNIIWGENGKRARYNFPSDGKVNDFQAVQWVSEFCQKYNYHIVVSSTWRKFKNYEECLINGGLREGIQIIGKTPNLGTQATRGDEIAQYLAEHPEVENYLIFDDENDFKEYPDMIDRFVECANNGFNFNEYQKAEQLHEKYTEMPKKS